jgi:hypothetical protein
MHTNYSYNRNYKNKYNHKNKFICIYIYSRN